VTRVINSGREGVCLAPDRGTVIGGRLGTVKGGRLGTLKPPLELQRGESAPGWGTELLEPERCVDESGSTTEILSVRMGPSTSDRLPFQTCSRFFPDENKCRRGGFHRALGPSDLAHSKG